MYRLRRFIACLLIAFTALTPLTAFSAVPAPFDNKHTDMMQHHSVSVDDQKTAVDKDGKPKCIDCADAQCPHDECTQSSCLDCGACVSAVVSPLVMQNLHFQPVWLASLLNSAIPSPAFSLFRPPKS